MDCTQTIRARRSIRKFKPGVSIPRADVETMLEAAMMAPSARNTRPWEFFVVEDPEIKARIRAAHPYSAMLDTASLAIVVCAQPEAQADMGVDFWPLDCGAAIENLLLQAAALGYGTCWCGCYPAMDRAKAIQAVLGAKAIPTALISVGVPDEAPARKGFYQADKVTWL